MSFAPASRATRCVSRPNPVCPSVPLPKTHVILDFIQLYLVSVGMLDGEYDGSFPVGDAQALAHRDCRFLATLIFHANI